MKNRKYSTLYKLKCVELVKIIGIYWTSIVVEIIQSCIRKWYLKILEEIENRKSTNRIPSKQNRIKEKYEKEILELINRCKEFGIPLKFKIYFWWIL